MLVHGASFSTTVICILCVVSLINAVCTTVLCILLFSHGFVGYANSSMLHSNGRVVLFMCHCHHHCQHQSSSLSALS